MHRIYISLKEDCLFYTL